ncbi:MAG: amidase [Burkholderiaceae bacterium]
MEPDLAFLSATDQAAGIRQRRFTATALLHACINQVERLNPSLNAIVTQTFEVAQERAHEADAALSRGEIWGPLHGLIVAHKDLFPTKGVRTTYGSKIYEHHVPEVDAIPVERLKGAGGISIGKTNTPEFGAGSQTFNEVFGATCNPYDVTKTCGGSSGGAAVAVATGMVSLADGTDLGGSLRNPANFCNVVGLRPSPGRVPNWPDSLPWFPYSVAGPIARTVQDVALAMQVMAGPDSRSPIALETPGSHFAQPLERFFQGVRVAFSPTLGGLPVERAVLDVVAESAEHLRRLGCEVIQEDPDLSSADEIFEVWRAWRMELRVASLPADRRPLLKETVIWNAQQGEPLTGPQLSQVESKHADLFHRMRRFMERFEFILAPVNQVVPFPVHVPYPTEIEGVSMEHYIDWQKSCYRISACGNPAISVPAGFTSTGLPVGVQLIGRYRDDFGLLQLAHAFEGVSPAARRRPPGA